MKHMYRMIDIIQQDINFYKVLVIVVSSLLCMVAAFYSNLYLKADIVYTHYFYIPIILTGLWYGKETIYLALYLGVFHILVNFIAFGSISISSLQRPDFYNYFLDNIYFVSFNEKCPSDLLCHPSTQ